MRERGGVWEQASGLCNAGQGAETVVSVYVCSSNCVCVCVVPRGLTSTVCMCVREIEEEEERERERERERILWTVMRSNGKRQEQHQLAWGHRGCMKKGTSYSGAA